MYFRRRSTLFLTVFALGACQADERDGVEVMVDELGIPHIYGPSDEDVAYAAGYQMATDRLIQMEMIRRRALGRQAEVVGPDLVDQDRISRVIDFRRWGRENMEQLEQDAPEIYAMVEAWVEGVNTRIQEVRAGEVPLPHGFGPEGIDQMPELWELVDHFAVARLYFFGNSNQLETELFTSILQRYSPMGWDAIEVAKPMFPVAILPQGDRPAAGRDAAGDNSATPPRAALSAEQAVRALRRIRRSLAHLPQTGSNNWAIDGRHTDNGRPLVAGDPHQPLQSPSLMYAQHLNSADEGGKLDVIGWSFVGVAGVALGHNRNVQWTATTNFADTSDIWEVEVLDDGASVVVGDDVIAVDQREEIIEVAGGENETIMVADVPGYGVLLPEGLLPLPLTDASHRLLFNWIGFRPTTDEQGFVGFSFTEDIDAWEEAVDKLQISGFNLVAADADGISYRVNLLVPDRGSIGDGPLPYLVLPGDDASTYWQDFLPPEKLPRSHTNQRGWIASANNDPWGFTFDGNVTNDPWYYGAIYAAGHRAHLIEENIRQLTDRGNVTIEDMQQLQTNVESALSSVLLPLIGDSWASVDVDETLAEYRGNEDLAQLVEVLENWDKRMALDSSGAVVFHIWLNYLAYEVVQDDLSILFNELFGGGSDIPFLMKIPALTVTGEYAESAALLGSSTREQAVLAALQRTADYLEEQFGTIDPSGYQWGDLHGTSFENVLGGDLTLGWIPSPGGEDTINVSSSVFFEDAPAGRPRLESTKGPIFRVVTRFAEDGTPEAFAVFPPGNAADPQSPHFGDLAQPWADGEYFKLPFRREEVEDAATDRFSIERPAQ